jgi:hypothetical protein
MPDDQIKLVQLLIDSGKGDIDRLRLILDTLLQGSPLSESDHNYLQEFAKQTESENLTAFTSAETSSPNTEKSTRVVSPEDSPDKVSRGRKEAFSKTPRKRVIIAALIIGIVISAYIGTDVYAVTMLQFRPHHGNQYLISQTKLFIQAEVCNPSYFPASFNKYEINAFYQSQSIEKAEISGIIISPKTYTILDGEFNLNQDAITKLQQQNARFDPTQAHIVTTVDAPIFGVIPFSVVKEYGAIQFQQVLKNGPPSDFSCA